jgi:hypothetical protein
MATTVISLLRYWVGGSIFKDFNRNGSKKLLIFGQTFWELINTKHQLLAGPVVPN